MLKAGVVEWPRRAGIPIFSPASDRGGSAARRHGSRGDYGHVLRESGRRAILNLWRAVCPDFLEPIYQLTEGNPFFVEEVLTSLMAASHLSDGQAPWDQAALDALRIPRTVESHVSSILAKEKQSPPTWKGACWRISATSDCTTWW